MSRNRDSRSGWSLLEVLIAATLTVGVVAKGALVVRSAMEVTGVETAGMHYEDQARIVIDRIALAVMGSDRDTILPQIEELSHKHIRYSFSLGIEDGAVVWSLPEEIRMLDGRTSVEWREDPEGASQRHAVWTNMVSPLLEGEEINGIDDNGNGLVDEEGLSFVLEGDRIVIRLTLRRPDSGGRLVQETVESVVFCRN